MKTIYKYKLIEDTSGALPTSKVTAPVDYLLKVDFQNGEPYLWAVIDTDYSEESFEIVRVGTGWQIPEDEADDLEYINTTVASSEPFVWHWFLKEQGW